MSTNIYDPTGLSQLFHLNSEPWIRQDPQPTNPFHQRTKFYPDAERVALPETSPGAVDQLAVARVSQRAFADKPMPLNTFAGLLRTAYGVTGPANALGNTILRRPVPSAGALYPLEVYALVRNVSGIAAGIYHYDAIGDDLAALGGEGWDQAAAHVFLSWESVATAPVILCLGAEFARTQAKYGPRGYRYVLFEAGHVTQNLCLAAEERGLSSLCMGGYYDAALNKMIGLDGTNEAIVYTIAIGEAA
ncbi:SagB/ThcOx family dehydrogenase [Cognatiyoonia sp. IB215182]|uniref:SagB/ThcOx family dehydrogenase n=1 Tax=Cognatiyoonia sp. IB215182 TaxID=3097353 RepID=UPI002A0B124A|nr:SagB/ThcOx family dehydrogenase [Cognatiyoonia sp. IB215182]MDX8353927.1 SagB/ThcOx family dehydrogenase [Cognatiyoonia sp. IB215182]